MSNEISNDDNKILKCRLKAFQDVYVMNKKNRVFVLTLNRYVVVVNEYRFYH